MEHLLGLIAALVEAWKSEAKKRTSIGSDQRRASLAGVGRALRAFAERRTNPAGVTPRPSESRAPASPAIGSLAASDGSKGQPTPVTQAQRVGGPGDRGPEAGLVSALFATPQSLVAAFIVAEVLAKPVALREP